MRYQLVRPCVIISHASHLSALYSLILKEMTQEKGHLIGFLLGAQINWKQNDPSINLILDCKIQSNTKPSRTDIDNTDPVIKGLWFQWESLEVKEGLLYRKWIDDKGDDIYQLIAADQIRQLIFQKLHTDQTAGHFGRDRTADSIRRYMYY